MAMYNIVTGIQFYCLWIRNNKTHVKKNDIKGDYWMCTETK